MTVVEVHADEEISRKQVEAARQRMASLEEVVKHPPEGARLTLRRGPGRSKRPFVADAHVVFSGRVLAAHAAGPSPSEAVDAVVERLRRQLRRVVGAEVAQRNEPAAIEKALSDLQADRSHRPEARLKPPESRAIVNRRTYADHPMATLEAIGDLLDLDYEFYLFRHVRTGEDAVVYRRDDGRIGLLFPRGSALADEGDEIIVPEPSRYPDPISLDDAREEMDIVNHRFLYFVDARDGRGKVLYLRHDGDYGLVEPE